MVVEVRIDAASPTRLTFRSLRTISKRQVAESEQIYVTHASERTKSVGQSGSPIERASQHASIGPVLDHEKYRKSKLVMLISTSSI
ncbi:unnamed protein product [Fusarium graminearum]|uniref:Uncharacterized protein n=1 Tax=Gibberella zeae TaxID=5518 RepID=A0A9N8WZ37_GIBZA|nr:unnamed protein product [Fusarium graminearum]CAG2010788.1 unnamed protein product [Fusarium graminearum]